MENTYALGHVTSVPKEQNLPMLFNEGENGQVTVEVQVLLLLHSMIKQFGVYFMAN